MTTLDNGASPDEVVGRSIAMHREGLGLTQRDLIGRLDERGWRLDPSAITRIEKGQRALRTSQIYLISDALECSPSDLLVDEVAELGLRRLDAQSVLIDARSKLIDFLRRLIEIQHKLYEAPDGDELLAESGFRSGSAEGYLEAVRDNVERYVRSGNAPHLLSLESEQDFQNTLEGIVNAVTSELFNVVSERDGGYYEQRRDHLDSWGLT